MLFFQKILHKSGVFEAIDLTNSIYFSFSPFPYLMAHCGCLFLDIPPRLFILFFVVVAKHWWCSLVKQKAFSWPFLRSQSRGLCPMPIRVARSNFSRSAKHGTSYTGQNWWLYTRGGGKARGLCWMVIHYKEQYNKGPCIMWFSHKVNFMFESFWFYGLTEQTSFHISKILCWSEWFKYIPLEIF